MDMVDDIMNKHKLNAEVESKGTDLKCNHSLGLKLVAQPSKCWNCMSPNLAKILWSVCNIIFLCNNPWCRGAMRVTLHFTCHSVIVSTVGANKEWLWFIVFRLKTPYKRSHQNRRKELHSQELIEQLNSATFVVYGYQI